MSGDNPPLVRDKAGPRRDFDINIDGMAHYGMLPDFLQDLRNVGLTARIWPRCSARPMITSRCGKPARKQAVKIAGKTAGLTASTEQGGNHEPGISTQFCPGSALR